MNVFQACTPRADIISGALNLEIFTASLDKAIRSVHGEATESSDLYTDAHKFFTEGTYATDGLKMILRSTLARLNGDKSVEALQRLDTAFGGGKTHSLIACVHAAAQGKNIASEIEAILGQDGVAMLPDPGEVQIVGLACDQIDLWKTVGTELRPYTLWGEMAMQLGGQKMYDDLRSVVEMRSAPGKDFFDTVLKGKKTLILIDEIAAYLHNASLYNKDSHGEEVNAAAGASNFIMNLGNYAKDNGNVSVVLTLASAKDAFSAQTAQVQKILGDINSVVARVAKTTTPIAAGEVSSVLTRRLFESVNTSTATVIANSYSELYKRNKAALPDVATHEDYVSRMEKEYPFHPSFMDFLNGKLAVSSTFQGTRGVLRMLSLTIRDLWKEKKTDTGMIHTGDINLDDDQIRDELFSRSGSNRELKNVLTWDVRSGDEKNPGQAEGIDKNTPHPSGISVYRDTWQSVFLNSLVFNGDFSNNAFGANADQITLEVLRPGISAANVENALKQLEEKAFFLQKREKRYYASLEPSINKALQACRERVEPAKAMERIHQVTNKLLKGTADLSIVVNVSKPSDVADKTDLQLVLPALDADAMVASEFFMYASGGSPRKNQNRLMLLMPSTVTYTIQDSSSLFGKTDRGGNETTLKNLKDTAVDVIAREDLSKNYAEFQLKPEAVEGDVASKLAERTNALRTLVAKAYNTLLYPKDNENCYDTFEVTSAGADGGADMINQIINHMKENGELLDRDSLRQISEMRELFCPSQNELLTIDTARKCFDQRRGYPMILGNQLFDAILREGVRNNIWWLVSNPEKDPHPKDSSLPGTRYGGTDFPLSSSVTLQDAWLIVSKKGIDERKWGRKVIHIDPKEAATMVKNELIHSGILSVISAMELLVKPWPLADEDEREDAAIEGLKQAVSLDFYAYSGTEEQTEKPEPLTSLSKMLDGQYKRTTVVISKKEAEKRKWLGTGGGGGGGGGIKHIEPIHLDGDEARRVLCPLLRRLPKLKNGAKSTLSIEINGLHLPLGGEMNIVLNDLTPQSFGAQRDVFESIGNMADGAACDEVYISIENPAADCELVKEIQALRDGK